MEIIEELIVNTEKSCTKCLISYPATNEYFYSDKTKIDKLTNWCRDCMKKKSLIHYHENKEAHFDSKKKWKEKNREKILDYQRNYRLEHLEETQIKLKNYQTNYKDKINGYTQKRNAKKKHKISNIEWIKCKEFFRYSCAYCGMTEESHLEQQNQGLHKEHVDDEGSNKIDNCVPSCRPCNSTKWKHPFDDWYSENNPIYNKQRYEKIIDWLNLFSNNT